MIQTMEQSSDTTIGYTVIGEVGQADFQTLVPAVQAAIDKNGTIRHAIYDVKPKGHALEILELVRGLQ